jgi:hypothetical protein
VLSSDIAPNAQRFIRDHITSVAQLEMLLLLRTNPQQAWSAVELARELRVDPAWAEAQMCYLHEKQLIELSAASDPVYRYCPATPELEATVTALTQAYLVHRVSVIELIYDKPPEALRALADAFRIRKKPPHG